MQTVIAHLGYCRHCKTNSIGHGKAVSLKDKLMLLTLHRIYRCDECGYTRYKMGRRRLRTAIAVVIILAAASVTVAMLRDGIQGIERHGPISGR